MEVSPSLVGFVAAVLEQSGHALYGGVEPGSQVEFSKRRRFTHRQDTHYDVFIRIPGAGPRGHPQLNILLSQPRGELTLRRFVPFGDVQLRHDLCP